MVSSSSTDNNDTINKRSSKGRQKIAIKKIERKSSRHVTFSKRRVGLFKKAVELCILTGAKVAILVNSPGGNVYVFGEDLIDWYINNFVETSQLGFPRNEFNQCYDAGVSRELGVENRREMILSSSNNIEESAVETSQLESPTNKLNEYYAGVSREVENRRDMISSSSGNSEEEWIDGMDIEQLEEYICSLEEMKKDAVAKADAIRMNMNIPAKLDSDEMKEIIVNEANNLMMINNSPAMLDLDGIKIKQNTVREANDLMMINNSPAMLDSDEIKKNTVKEANDLMMINNSQAMLDSDLSLDMSCFNSDSSNMSWMDSISFDMGWNDSYFDHGDTNKNKNDTFNLNFQHGVEV